MDPLNPGRWGWFRPAIVIALGCLASATLPLDAQGPLARRLDRLLDQPPFNRGTWGVVVADSNGRVLFERNADRLLIPASTAKIVVGAVALALLGPDYRITTSVYGGGPLLGGELQGDLVVYGRGDPTFSRHCYDADTLAAGACDSLWTRIDALADSLVERGVQQVNGAVVGDGSYFAPQLVHPAWEGYDLNWWYAAPVSGLGFNDNSLNITWQPGPRVGAPAGVAVEPQLGNFVFENRTRTVPAGSRRTIDFFRRPGTMFIWGQGDVPLDTPPRTEYFAVPDPNRYFAQALRAALARKGVAVSGPTASTTDSLRYREAREAPALVTLKSRPLAEMVFPILNASHNWFAEMLLKVLGRERGSEGSWPEGLRVTRQFLMDSVGVDSSAFALTDGSGLARGNLITARALALILAYTRRHAAAGPYLRALPRSGLPGSLRERLRGTPLEGRVLAKTGSMSRVNSLAGYLERPRGGPLVFAVLVNNHLARYADALAQIDSMVVEMAR